MPGSWKPDMSLHSEIIDFISKANADNYVQAGWELIETRTELVGEEEAVLVYRVGWPKGAGEPFHPADVPDEGDKPSSVFRSLKPSAN